MSSKRSQALEKIAFDLDLKWYPEDSRRTLPFLKDFKLFKRGGRKRIYNLMQGRSELLETDVRVFDYHYLVSGGNYHKRYKQTVFFVQSQSLGLPQLYLRPETVMHKIGEYLNLTEDIDFDRFPVFSKHYRLVGEDESFIRSTLNEDVLHFFTFNKHWWFEGINFYFILYKSYKLIPPEEIQRFYKMGTHLIRMLKTDFP